MQEAVILVLEDNDQARFVIRALLEQQGYTVVEATNEAEAIAICERAEQPIHLLISDVILSNARGTDVARRITSLRPELPIVFVSGYSPEDLEDRGWLGSEQFSDRRMVFLQKPFAPAVLLDSVKTLVAG
jgi:two-component system cell cycle sensor histidine kinase/response regulator CckA